MKRLETLRQRREGAVAVPMRDREMRLRPKRMTTAMTFMTKELEVRRICREAGLEHLCMICDAYETRQVKQFVRNFRDEKTKVDRKKFSMNKELVARALKLPTNGHQALHEKGRLSELKDMVIKVASIEIVEGVKADRFPRAKMPDPWKGMVTVINAVLLNNWHITSLFAPALRILAAIKYGEPVGFADFMRRRIKRNISLWQEGKEHEIIYPGVLQLLIGQAFSEMKGKAKVGDALEDVAETLLQVARSSQRRGSKKRKRKALLAKELGSIPSTSGKDQQDEVRTLQAQWNREKVHLKEQVEQKEEKIKFLQGQVLMLEEELKVKK
eukprot:Gb_41328 [translate_table: standard]